MAKASSSLPRRPFTAVLLTFLGNLLLFGHVCPQVLNPHGPPRVDRNPQFLDSFVPASLQVISHATDLMKYEVPAVSTEPPPPATSSHRPGVYAPKPQERPPSFYYRELVRRIREEDAKKSPLNQSIREYFGKTYYEVLNNVNVEDVDGDGDLERFLRDYDDDFEVEFARKKKPPPPKAYVTLLSLYDGLNREAKKLGLNKYAGYTKDVLLDLEHFSRGTSSNQMREIFSKIIERNEVKQEKVAKTLKTLIEDLEDPKSYINDALKDIPPLRFDADL